MAASSAVHRPAAARVRHLREAALPGERFAVKAVLPVLQRSLAQAPEHHALLRFRAAVEYPGAVLPAEAVRWVRQAARRVHPATHTIAAAVPAAATTAVAVRALPEAVIAEVRPEAGDTAVAAARQGAAAVAAGKRSVSVNLTFLKV